MIQMGNMCPHCGSFRASDYEPGTNSAHFYPNNRVTCANCGIRTALCNRTLIDPDDFKPTKRGKAGLAKRKAERESRP